MSKHFNDEIANLSGETFLVVPYSTTHWLHFKGTGSLTVQILIGKNSRTLEQLQALPSTDWADLEEGQVTLPDNVGRRICAMISAIKLTGTGTYSVGITSGDA